MNYESTDTPGTPFDKRDISAGEVAVSSSSLPDLRIGDFPAVGQDVIPEPDVAIPLELRVARGPSATIETEESPKANRVADEREQAENRAVSDKGVRLAFARLQAELEAAERGGNVNLEAERKLYVENVQAKHREHGRAYEEARIEYVQAVQGLIDACTSDGRRLESTVGTPRLSTLRFGFVQEATESGESKLQPVVSRLDVKMLDVPEHSDWPALERETTFRPHPEDRPRYVVGVTRRDMPAVMVDESPYATEKLPSNIGKVEYRGDTEHVYHYDRRSGVDRTLPYLPDFKDITQHAVADVVGSSLVSMDMWGLSRSRDTFPAAVHDGQKLEFTWNYQPDSYGKFVNGEAETLLRGLHQWSDRPDADAFRFLIHGEADIENIMQRARSLCGSGLYKNSLHAKPLLEERLQWLSANLQPLRRAAVDVMYRNDAKIRERIGEKLIDVTRAASAASRFLLDFWLEAPLPVNNGQISQGQKGK